MKKSREIKFRGWSLYDEKWVYGYLTIKTTKRNLEKHCFIYSESGMSGWRVDPESVGQYTGLKDGGSNEIYEGDILKGTLINSTISDAVVVFHNGGFQAVQLTHERYSDDLKYMQSFYVKGNTYE